MRTCEISVILAYAMSIYCLASGYYLIFSRFAGTPFKDSLSYEQISIQKRSAEKRKKIFLQGVVLSCIFLCVLRPFSKC